MIRKDKGPYIYIAFSRHLAIKKKSAEVSNKFDCGTVVSSKKYKDLLYPNQFFLLEHFPLNSFKFKCLQKFKNCKKRLHPASMNALSERVSYIKFDTLFF